MSSVDKAIATQLANIETRTGKSLDELAKLVHASGLTKHGQIRDMLKRDLGMGHGDANMLVHYVLKSASGMESKDKSPSVEAIVAEIYAGDKEALRPIHDKLMAAIEKFGEFEIAPKKGYLSLRRKKQFAMIGPATKTRVEVGLNIKDLPASERLVEMPPKSMCNYKVKVTDVKEVNKDLIAWIKKAYQASG